jgi:hypothetical protein
VAAGEDQLQPLVREMPVFGLVERRLGDLEQLRLLGEVALATDPIDRSVAPGRNQPGAWVRRSALSGPALRRDRERLLSGLLGEVEVAEKADQ